MKTKISSDQLGEVLSAVPGTLRALADERDYWRKEAQSRMRREEAAKVAHAMHEKGISMDTPIDSLVDQLEKAASTGKLSKIAEAVDLVGPDMGHKIAHLTGDDNARGSSMSSHEFERFILGGVG
jgi:hypothetical protein